MLRTALVRAGRIALTTALFALCHVAGSYFEIGNSVSILYPGTAVSIITCMTFGPLAAIGVILGTLLTPWNADVSLRTLLVSGLVIALQGLIPWLVFRLRPKLTTDLRDMKSLVTFLLFGTIVNTAVTAIAGDILVIPHEPGVVLVWREVFVWWIADFVAALLLATPILAFGGALLNRGQQGSPRTIANGLQIVTVIILLGFAASFAIRTDLLNRLEEERLAQQQQWLSAQEQLDRMHSNFIRAAFLDPRDPAAATRLDAARRTNEEYIRVLGPKITGGSPELAREFPLIAAATMKWFSERSTSARDDARGAAENGRYILVLRAMLERANAAEWASYAEARRKIMLATALVDGMVFLILVFASVTLLYTISRPFAQLGGAIRAMRAGEPLDASRIDGRYVEFRSVAEKLEETSRELRRREEELRLQTEKAVRASRHKSDFLAKMSHELRTPLNSIIGFSDLLAEQEATISSQKRLGFLENVANSAKHLLKMINDLLDIAKVESGKMKLQLEEIDLRHTIANTVASIQPLFVRKLQEVEVLTPSEPMSIYADPGRIEQVLLNLLSNANKFTGEGETIIVRGSAEPEWWRIDIADHGIGIGPEDQQRIFDEFEQVSAVRLHSTGTGLGLALARRFVEAHGGTIAVVSALGEGATFTVRLPRERRRLR